VRPVETRVKSGGHRANSDAKSDIRFSFIDGPFIWVQPWLATQTIATRKRLGGDKQFNGSSMLSYDTKAWWKLIFQFHEGDTLRTLLPNISIVALFTLLVVYFNSGIMPGYLKYTATVHNLFGFVISLLLVFRTNTAYDRWWEGRRLWGSLFNTSRNIALKCHSYLDAQDRVRARTHKVVGVSTAL
jgi:hypothetical protein